MAAQDEVVQKIDARPLILGHLHVQRRFAEEELYPVVEVSIEKLLDLAAMSPQSGFLTELESWDQVEKDLALLRAKNSVERPISLPWISVRTTQPHCFTSGFDVQVENDWVRDATCSDLMWPHRNTLHVEIKGGRLLLSALEALGHSFAKVQVHKDQAAILKDLCGSIREDQVAPGAANDTPSIAPVTTLRPN